jgi:hypothetical protein
MATMKTATAILLASAWLLLGCEQPPEGTAPVDVQTRALLGPSVIVERGNPMYSNFCTEAHVSNANLATFQNTILPAVLREGRVSANSPAYRQCLDQILRVGSVTMPHDGVTYPWGPYCPPGEPGCQLDGYRDPYWDLLAASSMTAAERGRVYARRVAAESLSPNNLHITCRTDIPKPQGGPLWTDDRAADEEFFLPPFFINDAVNAYNNRTANPRGYQDSRAYVAAVLWHEVMHVHKYTHREPANGVGELKQIPHIVGACLRDNLMRAYDNGCFSCPAGQLPMPSSFQAASCACVRDPAYVSTPAVSRSWTYSSAIAPALAVDGHGQSSLMYVADTIYSRQRGGDWAALFGSAGTGSEVFAGGDTIALRFGSGHMYRNNVDRGWSYIGWSDPGTIAVDDLGTMYQRATNTIYRLRAGNGGWDAPLGGPFGALYAGGDQVFAKNGAGDIYRYTGSGWSWTGSPGAGFAVDAFGTLYGLSPNRDGLYRNRGGSNWDWIGTGGQRLEASNRLYAKAVNSNDVYRRFPDGTWQYTANCTSFTAGGNVLYCVHSSGSSHTIDVFETE